MHSGPSASKCPKDDAPPQMITKDSLSALQFTCGLSFENKFLAERTAEEGNEGLNQIMKMNFKKKDSKQLDESEKSELKIIESYSLENELR